MAKELPYFKFTVADWLTGDIVYEEFNIQGLFINICAIYWQREGKLYIEDINKRYKNPSELNELSGRFFSVNDGLISIDFLDEQLSERKTLSYTNSKNGKKGGRPKQLISLEEKPNANRKLTEVKAKESNIEKKREEKRIEDRVLAFKNALTPFLETYGRDMLNDFYNHWVELNKSKTKMRWELQKTWDFNLRLKKWASNEKVFKPNNTPTTLQGTI